MISELTVRELQEQLADSCHLRWPDPANPQAADNRLQGGALGTQPVPMAGYLNLIHPPQAQVIGATELEFLQKADSPEHGARHWRHARPCMA